METKAKDMDAVHYLGLLSKNSETPGGFKSEVQHLTR
jgi:hypothetical protein